ncbi:somatostatin-1 isoform X2 [Notolabrus celidotus]|nr:somatostatin-1 isoform X2 [Notolabrus celidotus]
MKRSIYQLNTSYSNSVNTQRFHRHFIIFLLYFGGISTTSSGRRRGSGNRRVLFEGEMLSCQFQVFWGVLFSSVLSLEVRAAPQPDMLMETLREDFTNDKVLTPFLLLRFMSELMATRDDEMIPEEEEVLGVRQEVMRRHLPLASYRERKAGCRNFFWKTFTSC